MELVVFYLRRPDDEVPKLLLIQLVKGTVGDHGLEGCTYNHFKVALAKLQPCDPTEGLTSVLVGEGRNGMFSP